MKHIFYIQSYVTYLVSIGVIEHQKLEDKDVLFISARNAISQKRFNEIDLNVDYPELFGVPCYGKELFFINHYKTISSFDDTINRFCGGEKFICYLPTNKHFCMQLIMTHPKCVNVNYIEEGLFSYNNEFRKTSWPFHGIGGKIKRFLNTGNRNCNPRIANNNRSILYTLFDSSYYSTDIPVKCSMPCISNIVYNGIRLHHTNILMMNAFRDASPQVITQLLKIVKRFATELSNRHEYIYIKHHPYASQDFKRQIEDIFSDSNVSYTVMDEKLNTELMLFNSKELSIYGFFSAAMMYGAMMGHQSISFLQLFEAQSRECKDYLETNFHIPEIFFKYSTNYEI